MLPISSQELVPDDMDAPFDAQQWLGEGGELYRGNGWTILEPLPRRLRRTGRTGAPALRRRNPFKVIEVKV